MNVCWMSLRWKQQHELGGSIDCLMCAAKRAEDAARSAAAVATGVQRPAATREVKA